MNKRGQGLGWVMTTHRYRCKTCGKTVTSCFNDYKGKVCPKCGTKSFEPDHNKTRKLPKNRAICPVCKQNEYIPTEYRKMCQVCGWKKLFGSKRAR